MNPRPTPRLRPKTDLPPRVTPAEGANLIGRQLERLGEIQTLPYNHPRHEAWLRETRDVLNDIFGKPDGDLHEKTQDFLYGLQRPVNADATPVQRQARHNEDTEYRVQRLRSFIEELHGTAVPAPDENRGRASGLTRWRVLKLLGQGGQAKVSLVTDREGVDVRPQDFSDSLSTLVAISTEEKRASAFRVIEDTVGQMVASNDPRRLGALKQLHAAADARDPARAIERMRREIGAMREIHHPNLLRILDADPDHSWYVSEYHEFGTLSTQPDSFRGDALAALEAIRPMVAGVSRLHDARHVHRDIKPDNVFIASDGRLVLGDFGLIYVEEGDNTRLSGTLENVGSRDWMPPWAETLRAEEINPDFDVFSIGKTLWYMVNGGGKLQLWYFNKPRFDLQQKFPNKPEMRHLNALLAKCVVETPEECLRDAAALLNEIDNAIVAIRDGVEADGARLICSECGRGEYQIVADGSGASMQNFGLQPRGSGEFRAFACDNCGHTRLHFRSGNFKPKMWPRD